MQLPLQSRTIVGMDVRTFAREPRCRRRLVVFDPSHRAERMREVVLAGTVGEISKKTHILRQVRECGGMGEKVDGHLLT